MIDREKVIRAVDSCFNYWLEQHRCLQPSELENVRKFKADALAILKEQETVLVTQREIAHMLFWCCGSCGVPITSGDKFCRNCGKAVKWK